MMLRRFAALFLAVLLALATAAVADSSVPTIETDVKEISKFGNLVLSISAKSLQDQGYECGDMLTVTVSGHEMEIPLCSDYSDVDNGDLVCRLVHDDSADNNTVITAINMGDLATTLGIAEKSAIDEEPGFTWTFKVDTPVAVTVAMKEKGGYADGIAIHHLVRTNNRADYPDLTDEQYANFRNVTTTGMGAWALCRSSSPINPELNRNKEADEALSNAGVRTVMNLADTEERMKSYEGYAGSYYSQRDVIVLDLTLDFTSDDFGTGLAKGMAYFASHEGPYLVHCTEGKDRAGVASAVLECLMGATAEEVVADYMVTFYNFYGIEQGTEKYDLIRQANIEKTLNSIFGIEDLYKADLASCAEQYLRAHGLDDSTIEALKTNLGKSYAE